MMGSFGYIQHNFPKGAVRLRKFLFAKLPDPCCDLFLRVNAEQPAQLGAVAKLQGALDDGVRVFLRIQGREVVFLEERGEAGGDGLHKGG
jgi:hypothetical protein